MVQIEVCANSLDSALAAQKGGAIRVELCDNLYEGGTTPSYAQIALAKRMLTIQIYPIIRPRSGDFLYNELEFELMKMDIEMCKSLKCDGIVIGMLTADGLIDKKRCAGLIEIAQPMSVSFHRAFDMSNNLEQALEDVIELGCKRILTSGGQDSALKGAVKLAELIKLANGRIDIMPGAGISEKNITDVIRITGAKEFHASAKHKVRSKMQFHNRMLKMGASIDEYCYDLTDEYRVKNLLQLANSAL